MATTSSSAPRSRGNARHRRAASAVAGLIAAGLLGIHPCGSAAEPRTPSGKTAAETPSLPAAPNRVGRIRRDEDGRIVPAGPPLPPVENAVYPPPLPDHVPPSPASPAFPGSPPAGALPYDSSYFERLQSRQAHAERARLRQQEIDRILREEAGARGRGAPVDGQGLTAREAALAQELARRDEELRRREMRRYLLARPYAAYPEYWYVTGPGGQRFAVGGATQFDATMVAGDPAATLRKLETIRRAILGAPSPTGNDDRIVQEIQRLMLVLRQRSQGSR